MPLPGAAVSQVSSQTSHSLSRTVSDQIVTTIKKVSEMSLLHWDNSKVQILL